MALCRLANAEQGLCRASHATFHDADVPGPRILSTMGYGLINSTYLGTY